MSDLIRRLRATGGKGQGGPLKWEAADEIERLSAAPSAVSEQELLELRVLCRLAWNNWPDSENSRREISTHEVRDPHSAAAWDRVVSSILKSAPALDAPHRGEREPNSDAAQVGADTHPASAVTTSEQIERAAWHDGSDIPPVEVEVAWLSDVLSNSIANLGYPVGMGVAPHPEQIRRAAETLFERYAKMIEMARYGALSEDAK